MQKSKADMGIMPAFPFKKDGGPSRKMVVSGVREGRRQDPPDFGMDAVLLVT